MSNVLRKLLGRVSGGAASFIILTYFVAIATAIALVTFSQFASQLQELRVYYFFGAFLVYPIFTPIPIDLLLLSDTCIIVYIANFIVAFRGRTNFFASISRLREAGRITRGTNWLVVMPFVSSAMLVVVIVITLLLNRVGLPSGVPCNPLPGCIVTPKAFALLAYSPIIEEITFRITPLGLVVAIRLLLMKASLTQGPSNPSFASVLATSFLSPDSTKTRLGLGSRESLAFKSIHFVEWIAVIITSVAFGLAHVFSPGTSWDLGKAVTAGLSGFVLGTVFLFYGAYAAILLHWFFDFYLETFEVGANVFGETFTILGGLASLVIFLVGILSIVVALAWLAKRIALTNNREPLGSSLVT